MQAIVDLSTLRQDLQLAGRIRYTSPLRHVGHFAPSGQRRSSRNTHAWASVGISVAIAVTVNLLMGTTCQSPDTRQTGLMGMYLR